MKKLLVVLLSLGLIVAFAATASAVDVKFSGQYYVTGQYENNRSLGDTDNARSLANFWTRTRVQTVFKVAEGLDFTTRFDALEKGWGVAHPDGGANYDRTNSRKVDTVANEAALQENIEFEQAYVTFNTAVGQFNVGYQAAGEWGTGFANVPNSRARVKYALPLGPVTFLGIYEKEKEDTGYADADYDQYMLAGVYKFTGGDAGLLYVFANAANPRPAGNYRVKKHMLAPYIQAKFGPVYVEGEVVHYFGEAQEFDNAGTDVKAKGWGAYALARMNMGPAYFGASFGYSTGDNDPTDDKDESGPQSTTQWSPGIIFGDANYRTWNQVGNIGGANPGTSYDNLNKVNLLAYNVFAGFNATPKLNIDLQFWGLQADVKPTGYDSNKYGYEFDATATYKIYDNLSYMVGAGYFWAGDYFKGTNNNNPVGNDYVLLNKLTLSF